MARRIALLVAMTFVLAAPAGWTHDGHDEIIMGTVTARDAKHLKVKTHMEGAAAVRGGTSADWAGAEGDRRPASVICLTAEG